MKIPRKITSFVVFLFILGMMSLTFANNFSLQELQQIKPQFLKMKHGVIEYYRFGQGKPIILISGFATNVSSWNSQFLLTLASQHEVIVFDNRNVGGSVNETQKYSSADLAEDVYDLIQLLR